MTGTGRRAHLSGGEATLLSSHAGRSRAPGGRQNPAMSTKDRERTSQAPGHLQRDTDGSGGAGDGHGGGAQAGSGYEVRPPERPGVREPRSDSGVTRRR